MQDERRGRTDHRAVADRRAVVRFDAPDRRNDVAVDAIGSLHRIEMRAVFGENATTVGDARVGDEDIEIFPRRLGELGLRVEEIHDPQVGRNARQQLIEHLARHVAALRQRPDRFEAGAEIRRRGADRGRLHQRMAGGAVFAGPFARRHRPGGLAICGGRRLRRRAFRATRTASGGRNFARPRARRPRSAPSIRTSWQRRPAISATDSCSSSGPSPA